MFSQLGDKLQDIFKDLRGHGTISESNINDALRQVRLALLEADVDFQVAKSFVARVREKALGEEVLRSITPGQQIVKIFDGRVERRGENHFSCQTGALIKKAGSYPAFGRDGFAASGGDRRPRYAWQTDRRP